MIHTKSFAEEAHASIALVKGALPSIDLEDSEIVYAAAYGLYEKGDYTRSAGLFTHLVLRNPFEKSSWMGLASAHQMEKKYREALAAWSMIALLNAEDPLPHFHAAECLLSLQDVEEALKALNCAEKNLKNSDSELKDKIEVLKARYLQNV